MDIQQEMKNLINQLNYWTMKYDRGEPEVSDKEWDKVYFELANMERESGIYLPDSPTQKVPYDIVNSLEKVEHNHPMLSLDKTKDWDEFLNYFGDKDVIGMPKLDGLTCSLTYNDGWLVRAETRGNGVIGENIMHNARVIPSIPEHIPWKGKFVVDGEIICTEKDFEPFKNEYSNQRNFAAGSIRLLDSLECAKRKLTFVVWNVVKGFEHLETFSLKLLELDKDSQYGKGFGFTVVPWTSSFDWDAKDYLIEQCKKLGYPIDGLVGRFDDIKYGENLGATEHHARAAYAFKFYDEEYETTLRDIEWTMGRTGVLTPIAVFDPIDDGVSIIERASLHNVSVLKDTLHYPIFGQKIKVFKANQIIPQVSWGEEVDLNLITAEESIIIPDNCPICGQAAELIESDSETINLVCTNPHCEMRLINKLDHFFGKKGIDAKGFSVATIAMLLDLGWVKSILDVYHLREQHYAEWTKRAGFGKKSVDKILGGIDEASSHCPLAKFISAIGIPQIGTKAAAQLATEFMTWTEFRDAVREKWDFTKLPDFGDVMQYNILNFDYTEADKLSECISIFDDYSTFETALEGMTFVITGKLEKYKSRDALKKLITSYGGKVTDSVSKKTTYLINNDINSSSSKNKKAKELGVKIITEEDFIRLINE